ncbi:MAG TPA: DNA ligase D [Candidatus Binatia bacterium]|nr:DNA ligase D [Candidatus Binatia bacterium]
MKSPSNLDLYRKKRDPERTPEPFGAGVTAPGSRFVIQKHGARRLHYDLRLEMDGVLKSWAVPKGPSMRAEEKRLAVHVEDHPIDYADFEGVIPPDNYGAGAVIVWDRGRYRLVKPGDPLEQLDRGKLELEFFGHKVRGVWTLVRMSKKEKDWLLLKKADSFAGTEELTERYPRSVLSGLTLEEMADVPTKISELHEHLRKIKAPKQTFSARSQPLMLATQQEQPFSRPEWIFEIKYDGVRVLAERKGDSVELYGRNGTEITNRYPEIKEALKRLAVERFVIDGEIVALDERGQPSFQKLQARMHLSNPRDIQQAMSAAPVEGIFFDCLAFEGHDLRSLGLLERKEILKRFLPPLGRARYSDHVEIAGKDFFEAASERRLEGILAKKANSRYTGGRSRDWVKIKCQQRQEFVIGGYTDPQGERGYFGALHLGLYQDNKLIYVSKVGTGFDTRSLKLIWEKMQPLARAKSPFEKKSPTGRGNHWLEPALVCEVRYSGWTDDGGIRQPTFLGLRPDKKPEECRKEEPEPLKVPELPLAAPAENVPDKQVKFTNLKKIFWPDEGYTKEDLIQYYRTIAPLLLPYLKNRPLVLTRYPDGIAGKSFFQKDAPEFVPSWIRREKIYSKDTDRDIGYIIVDDLETLLYVINMGTIPLHLWSSRVDSLERPDWLVLDLDPKGAPFSHVVEVACAVHEILTELRLESFIKTSGASGLHILVPLGARYTHEQAKNFARLLAILGAESVPDISTIARPIAARRGKVYIDFGQNGYGVTIAAPFAVRPLRKATVSCPLLWQEVNARLDPSLFTIETVPPRFQKMKDPMASILRKGMDLASALKQVEKMIATRKSTSAQ